MKKPQINLLYCIVLCMLYEYVQENDVRWNMFLVPDTDCGHSDV